MKYKFGDTLIKNNRAYIIIGDGAVGEEQHYYLQSRSGTLAIKNKDQIDKLIKRGYELHKDHCNLTYPVARDFKVGDLIVGRRQNEETGKYEKQTGIIISIRRRKRWWHDKKTTKVFMIAWSSGEHIQHYWTQIEHYFVPFVWHNMTTYRKWKHLPVVK